MITIVIVVAGAAFFGGMQFQNSKKSATTGQLDSGQGSRGGGFRGGAGARGGNRPVAGEILSSDDKSITVKLMDGSSKIVILNDKTQINKATTATKTDLKKGEQVAVFGQTNSDGSVTAQNISIGGRMFGRPRDITPTKGK